MIIYKEAAALKKAIENKKQEGKSVGFVPTMGALHKGHLALIDVSIKNNNVTVCSIFVNPTQFNDPEDFKKYPSNIVNDISLLTKAGCDVLFFPSVSEMYPQGTEPVMHYDLGDIEYTLEGKYRPGHFQGVCRIVHKLIDIVRPDNLYLGQKDYQQCMVIKRLVQLVNLPVKVNISDTVREATGLAMSSRNQRLSDEQKENAEMIFKMLVYLKKNYNVLPFEDLYQYVSKGLLNNGFHKIDYIAVADADTLQPAVDLKTEKLVALIAAFIGEVRLIDNIVLND